MREEAPLYYNEQHDFFAVSRFDDVESVLKDPRTFSSARGGILELIKMDMDLPSGVFIFEDPPIHTAHRGVLSRVFTPKKMNALEPQIRASAARSPRSPRRVGPARLRRPISAPGCRCR